MLFFLLGASGYFATGGVRQQHAVSRVPSPKFALSEGKERRGLINRQFIGIAVPALAQFTAEPIAGLVDTAYLGRLGASALGGAGVAISTHYALAKVFNDP